MSCLKIVEYSCSSSEIFSSVKSNYFCVRFTFMLKMHANGTGSGSTSALGHPVLLECMGTCFMRTAHESEPGDFRVHVYVVENLSGFFFLKLARVSVHVLGWSLLRFYLFIVSLL